MLFSKSYLSDGRHLINQNVVVVVITDDRRSAANKVSVICDSRESGVRRTRERSLVEEKDGDPPVVEKKDLITHDEEEA